MVNFLKTLEEYNSTVSGNKLVVVDFTASWCPPCKMIGPEFVKLAAEEANSSVTFVKVDVDENAEAAKAAGISCMPTFKFFKDGVVVDTLEGADLEGIKAKLAKLMA